MDLAQRVVLAFLDRVSGISKADLKRIQPILAQIPVRVDPDKARFIVEEAKKKQLSLVNRILDGVKTAIGIRVAREFPTQVSKLRGIANDDELLASILTVLENDPEVLGMKNE